MNSPSGGTLTRKNDRTRLEVVEPGASTMIAKPVSQRIARGNTLALVVAFMVVLGFILLFSIGYVRLLGSNQEQRTAIEGAALAAAKDISRIVIDTPECGYVGLSDAAPVGKNTIANDNYFVQVRSINTLIGTARTNLIIATLLGDTCLQDLAREDLKNAKKVKTDLYTALDAAIKPGGSGKDLDGNVIFPYQDAEDAYKANVVRMTGGASSYVSGSLRLTLGCVQDPIQTNIPVPVPTASAPVPSSQQQNNCYLSNMNVIYNGEDFVFAPTGNNISLVEPSKFVASVAGLPYQMPFVVRAEADHRVSDNNAPAGRVIHAIACAAPANNVDRRPAAGALVLSFPDGHLPEIQKPEDLYKDATLTKEEPDDILTSFPGDFPSDPLAGMTKTTIPGLSSKPTMADVWRACLHDWFRQIGPTINVQAAVIMQTTPLSAPPAPTVTWKGKDPLGNIVTVGTVPGGCEHKYTWNPSTGVINCTTKTITPYPYSVVGEAQVYAELVDHGIKSSMPELKLLGPIPFGSKKIDEVKLTKDWDVYIRDYVRSAGVTAGIATNKHKGGPRAMLDKPRYLDANDFVTGGYGCKPKGAPPLISEMTDFAQSTVPPVPYASYSSGPAGGQMRPSYLNNGVAVEIRFRRQVELKGSAVSSFIGIDKGYVGEMLP